MKSLASAAVLAAGLLAAAPSLADPAPAPPAGPTIVRGTIAEISGNAVKIKALDGAVVSVTLTPDWSVQVTKAVTLEAIQPGSFIGTAEMPQADGTGRSLEVHVFPPGVKMGEGHYGWDLKKGSMMTNGTVGKILPGAQHGREIDVTYSTGVRHIVVPANIPIVQISPGARELAKPGVKVFVVALKTPAGGLAANGMAVGEGGAAPPM